METRHIGVLSAVVGLVGVVTHRVPSYFLNQWLQGGVGGGLPTFGTAGQTVVIYNHLVGAVASLATVLLAVWFGYRVGGRLDLTAEYRRFGVAVAAGTLASAPLAWAAMTFVEGVPSPTPAQALLTLAVLVRLVASVSLVVTVGVFAGAALSHFRANEGAPGHPTESDHPTETDADGRASSSGTHS